VKSFRTDFGSEIDQRGLDAVITRLEQQIASGTVKKPTEAASKSAAKSWAKRASKLSRPAVIA
jgi:hypothetical protein